MYSKMNKKNSIKTIQCVTSQFKELTQSTWSDQGHINEQVVPNKTDITAGNKDL